MRLKFYLSLRQKLKNPIYLTYEMKREKIHLRFVQISKFMRPMTHERIENNGDLVKKHLSVIIHFALQFFMIYESNGQYEVTYEKRYVAFWTLPCKLHNWSAVHPYKKTRRTVKKKRNCHVEVLYLDQRRRGGGHSPKFSEHFKNSSCVTEILRNVLKFLVNFGTDKIEFSGYRIADIEPFKPSMRENKYSEKSWSKLKIYESSLMHSHSSFLSL